MTAIRCRLTRTVDASEESAALLAGIVSEFKAVSGRVVLPGYDGLVGRINIVTKESSLAVLSRVGFASERCRLDYQSIMKDREVC